MQIFARLTKYDEKTHIAEGVITSEAVDKANEALDYDGSKKYFEEWSAGFAKATEGQSVGNLRAMHGKTVAGKLVKLEFDDAAKVIRTSAEVVDANEQEKCAKGCYTGFSIGGSYVEQKPHPTQKGVTSYIAKPTEVSLVDNPCNPDATFTYAKADGSTELRKYAPHEDNVPAPAEGVTAEERDALQKAHDGETNPLLKAALAKALGKVAPRSDTSPKKGESEYGDVKFADATNKKYPIDTAAHIRAAWNYINKAKNAAKYSAEDAKAIKAHIVAAWKEKIDPEGPPSAAKKDVADGDVAKLARIDSEASALVAKAAADPKVAGTLAKVAAFMGAPLQKGFWTVASLAEMLGRLEGLVCDTTWEESIEGDGSTIPAQLREAAANLCHILLAMAEEECEEAFAHGDYEDEDGEAMERAVAAVMTKAADLRKDAGPALEKRAVAAEAKVAELEKGATESVTKITGLQKQVTDGQALMLKAAEAIDEQKRVLNKIMAEPTAKRPALMAVSKSGDKLEVPGEEPEVKPVYKNDGTVDEVRTALRKSLSQPLVVQK